MAMKVVGVETEKIIDNNPNTYLKRAEDKLKIGKYDEAISEIELAIVYSNNDERIIEQCDRIKLALVRGNIKNPDFVFENKSQEEIRGMAIKVISDFKRLFNSLTFKVKCKVKANKTGVSYAVIKSIYISNYFRKINNALKIEGDIFGEDILYYNVFLDKAIKNINQNNIENCKKLIIEFYLVNIGDEIYKSK